MQPINIVTLVDVIAALSAGTLRGHLYMADNAWCSTGRGTAELATACYPGQYINWLVYPLDVQTPVHLEAIAFLSGDAVAPVKTRGAPASVPVIGATPMFYWSGYLPLHLPPGRYGYGMKIQLGVGIGKMMSLETPVLNVLSPFARLEVSDESAAGNRSDDR